MGVTVIGGLIFSTILTLLLVPAYFSIAIDIEQWIGRKFHRFVGERRAAGRRSRSGGVISPNQPAMSGGDELATHSAASTRPSRARPG